MKVEWKVGGRDRPLIVMMVSMKVELMVARSDTLQVGMLVDLKELSKVDK